VPTVGVLALQGDVREHTAVLSALGATVVAVRRQGELDACDALVLPGGESTAIAHLLTTAGLREPLEARLRGGLPVLGTCAGLILLARSVLDGRADQWSYGVLDVAVRRNGYGRQVASFESDVTVSELGVVHGVFIRAPRIDKVGESVDVLASLHHDGEDHAVLVRQGSAWGCCFHPELAGDGRIHARFLASI
jgi:pyridoxal 5'-phosphate synthase pdxT subunit